MLSGIFQETYFKHNVQKYNEMTHPYDIKVFYGWISIHPPSTPAALQIALR